MSLYLRLTPSEPSWPKRCDLETTRDPTPRQLTNKPNESSREIGCYFAENYFILNMHGLTGSEFLRTSKCR